MEFARSQSCMSPLDTHGAHLQRAMTSIRRLADSNSEPDRRINIRTLRRTASTVDTARPTDIRRLRSRPGRNRHPFRSHSRFHTASNSNRSARPSSPIRWPEARDVSLRDSLLRGSSFHPGRVDRRKCWVSGRERNCEIVHPHHPHNPNPLRNFSPLSFLQLPAGISRKKPRFPSLLSLLSPVCDRDPIMPPSPVRRSPPLSFHFAFFMTHSSFFILTLLPADILHQRRSAMISVPSRYFPKPNPRSSASSAQIRSS